MGGWIGPAIIAALISGLVSLLGLYLGGWIAIRQQRRLRREKVRDFQIALRAEIRSELHNLAAIDFDGHLAEIAARYAASTDYSVFPSFPARGIVFEAIEGEIHILPEQVIDVVILHWRQRHAVEKMVEDMRHERFSQLGASRQLEMYKDYIEMQKYLVDTARLSIKALDRSLGEHSYFSSPAWVQSVQ
ncbi:hypothetical protein [Rhizobium sp.]